MIFRCDISISKYWRLRISRFKVCNIQGKKSTIFLFDQILMGQHMGVPGLPFLEILLDNHFSPSHLVMQKSRGPGLANETETVLLRRDENNTSNLVIYSFMK